MINVIIKEPGVEPVITTVSSDWETLENIVEGGLEFIPFPDISGVGILVSDEAKYDDSLPNTFLPENDDIIAGTYIVLGIDGKSGEYISLTDDQTKKVTEYIAANRAEDYQGDIPVKEYISLDSEDFFRDLFGEDYYDDVDSQRDDWCM